MISFLRRHVYVNLILKALEGTSFFKKEVHPVCCFYLLEKALQSFSGEKLNASRLYTKQTESIFLPLSFVFHCKAYCVWLQCQKGTYYKQ